MSDVKHFDVFCFVVSKVGEEILQFKVLPNAWQLFVGIMLINYQNKTMNKQRVKVVASPIMLRPCWVVKEIVFELPTVSEKLYVP